MNLIPGDYRIFDYLVATKHEAYKNNHQYPLKINTSEKGTLLNMTRGELGQDRGA